MTATKVALYDIVLNKVMFISGLSQAVYKHLRNLRDPQHAHTELFP